MDIAQRIIRLRQKCVGKLNRQDAEYFLDKCTIKDLYVYMSLINLKGHSFKDEFDFEIATLRYLQILMILSSVSDDPRDQLFVEKYMGVPFECEEIVKRRPPYKSESNIDRIFKYIRKEYPLEAYWNSGCDDTEILLSKAPKEMIRYMNIVLEHYSTPIVGVVAIKGIDPKEFQFMKELKSLFKYDLDHHYHNGPSTRVMDWVVKTDLKKLTRI